MWELGGQSFRRPDWASRPFDLPAASAFYIASGERVTTNPPISAFHFLDDNPCDRAHILALDRYHSVGELADHFLLLSWCKYTFDELYVYQRHRFLFVWLV